MLLIMRLWPLFGLLLLTACSSMPISSMVKLARVDFETTDLGKIRAAVKMPRMLQPRGAKMRVTVTLGGDSRTQDLALRLVDTEAERAATAAERDDSNEMYVYAIEDRDLPRLRMMRADMLKQKAAGGRGSLRIDVHAESCWNAPLPAGPVLMSTYLRTEETGGFAPLARDFNLRTLDPERDLVAAIPPCT